jgi:hypothetical protein
MMQKRTFKGDGLKKIDGLFAYLKTNEYQYCVSFGRDEDETAPANGEPSYKAVVTWYGGTGD